MAMQIKLIVVVVVVVCLESTSGFAIHQGNYSISSFDVLILEQTSETKSNLIYRQERG